MAVRFTILVLLTTVVVVVSSAGLLGEQWISSRVSFPFFFSFFFFLLLFFAIGIRTRRKETSDIRGPSSIRPKCSIRDAME